MGQAPKILEELGQTRERVKESTEWYLDTETGEMKPEVEPEPTPSTAPNRVPEARPAPVRIAPRIFD